MDYEYINTICEAYFNDRQLYKYDIFKSMDNGIITLQNEMKGIVQNLRLEDVGLYYDLQSHDKLDQQKIMYMLLDSYMIVEFPELIEEGPLEFLGMAGDVAADFFGTATTSLFKGATTWAGATIALAGFIFAIIFFKGLTRFKHSSFKLICDMVIGLTDIISKWTIGGRVKHAILNTHLGKCAGKCGLGTRNPWKEMSKFTTLAIKSSLPVTDEAQEQAECLIDCYLGYIISQIKTVAESYVNCLKSTNEFPGDLNAISLLEIKPMGEQCWIFYETLKKVEKEFEDAIAYIFDSNPRERQDWRNKFNNAILESMKVNQRQSFKPQLDSRQSSNRPDQRQKFNQNQRPPFKKNQRY